MSKTAPLAAIPSGDQLSLDVRSVIHRLPGDAIHNDLHNFGQQAAGRAHELQALAVASVVLVGMELRSIKESLGFGSGRGRPKNKSCHDTIYPTWGAWVKENCDFNQDTAGRYIRTAVTVAEGQLAAIPAHLLPENRPTEISRDELHDCLSGIAEAWRTNGEGGVRQLYLQLDAISQQTSRANLLNHGNRQGPSAERKTADPADAESSPELDPAIVGMTRREMAETRGNALMRAVRELREQTFFADLPDDWKPVIAEQLRDLAGQILGKHA